MDNRRKYCYYALVANVRSIYTQFVKSFGSNDRYRQTYKVWSPKKLQDLLPYQHFQYLYICFFSYNLRKSISIILTKIMSNCIKSDNARSSIQLSFSQTAILPAEVMDKVIKIQSIYPTIIIPIQRWVPNRFVIIRIFLCTTFSAVRLCSVL